MEQRNKPSTAEIVGALRVNGGVQRVNILAAERLEQLERDLEAFKAFHERYAEQTSKKYVDDICALTARAEKAEAERVLAVKALADYEDALSDEKDAAYNNGYSDGYQDGTKGI